MAINRVLKGTLKALSYSELDVRKSYKLKRKLVNAANPPLAMHAYKTWERELLVDGHAIAMRLFFPTDREEFSYPILLFFHGGGFVTGNIDSYSNTCAHMAQKTQHIVIAVDYRLAPEHPYPAALNDCYHAMNAVFSFCDDYQIDPNQVTLIGDSAGGNLVAAVSLLARDQKTRMPKRQILLYPATYNDHSDRSPFDSIRKNGKGYLLTSKRLCDYMDLYIGSHTENRQSPYFAPLLAKDFSNQPNTLIITADYDPLRDEGEAYGKRLFAAGNRVSVHRIPDALHGFIMLPPHTAPVKKTYRFINTFLREPF